MSLQLRQARMAVGDPGLFGFLGKAVGAVTGVVSKVVPGPIGLAAGLINRAAAPKTVKQATLAARPGGFGGVSIGPSGIQIGSFPQPPALTGGATPGGSTSVSGPLLGSPQQGKQVACTTGYHYNKSGYYSKRYGYVEKGTVCVRNRRRNPLNPRALSRAMSRVASAQKAVRCLGLFAGTVARASAKRGGTLKKGGSCRKCK